MVPSVSGGGGGHAKPSCALLVQVNDIGADGVQEDAVVGDDDHGLVILVQVLLQPHDSGKVEVVGGLIKQQYVRLQEQGTCNGNPGEDGVWGNRTG